MALYRKLQIYLVVVIQPFLLFYEWENINTGLQITPLLSQNARNGHGCMVSSVLMVLKSTTLRWSLFRNLEPLIQINLRYYLN